MLSRWRDSKTGRSEQSLQLIPSWSLYLYFELFLAWLQSNGRSHIIRPLDLSSFARLAPSHWSFLSQKTSIVACYARVDYVAWIQPKAEAGGPRTGPFKRVRGDVTEIRSLCWRMRGKGNPRPHGALWRRALLICAGQRSFWRHCGLCNNVFAMDK